MTVALHPEAILIGGVIGLLIIVCWIIFKE